MIGNYDIATARQLWRRKIAADRQAKFEANDIVIRDAQISGDQTTLAAAISRRDALRALGDRIDAAQSITELRAILPE